jgi:hypothetical protein
MYCPNCASPIDNVKFCRACGANVSLVPVAISGQLPAAEEENRGRPRHRRHKQPSVEAACRSIFTGLGFIAVSFAVMRYFPGGGFWWFWLFIPAFATIGAGIGELIRLRGGHHVGASIGVTAPELRVALPSVSPPPAIESPTTSQLEPPPSIVESTTRHLEASQSNEAQKR